jgi:peptidoglycan/LPS O-acetylase OafA/YrhL
MAGKLWMKRFGGPRAWLMMHEVLDFAGPILILVHAGLLGNPKFINLDWLTKSLQNGVAGIPAILAPIAMAGGLFGRYPYRRLPIMQRQFRYWRSIHIVLTAIFYVAGLTHILINTKELKKKSLSGHCLGIIAKVYHCV